MNLRRHWYIEYLYIVWYVLEWPPLVYSQNCNRKKPLSQKSSQLKTWLCTHLCMFWHLNCMRWAAIPVTDRRTEKQKHQQTTVCLCCACAPRHNYATCYHRAGFITRTMCISTYSPLKEVYKWFINLWVCNLIGQIVTAMVQCQGFHTSSFTHFARFSICPLIHLCEQSCAYSSPTVQRSS